MLVQRELSARYQGSILGNLWPLLNQLAQLLVYTYVFSIVLNVKLSLDGGQQSNSLTFGLWLFAGLVPWLAVSTGLTQACVSVKNQPSLVKKVVFPLSLLPLVPVGVAFLESTFGMMLLIFFGALFMGKIHPTIMLLPLVWAVQLLLTSGLGYWVASLTVFLRDIAQIVAVGLNLWFYGTPIIYPADLVPEPFSQWIFWFNPMTAIAEMYRDTILLGKVTHWGELGIATAITSFLFLSGVWTYKKLRPGFADVL